MGEKPITSIEELDPTGELRAQHEAFLKWQEEDGVKKTHFPSLCLLSYKSDKEGNTIPYCSILGFARLLDAPEHTLSYPASAKQHTAHGHLVGPYKPKWRYTEWFRKIKVRIDEV